MSKSMIENCIDMFLGESKSIEGKQTQLRSRLKARFPRVPRISERPHRSGVN